MICKGCSNRRIVVCALLVNVVIIYIFLYHVMLRGPKTSECLKHLDKMYSAMLRSTKNYFNIENLTLNDYGKLIDVEEFSFTIVAENICDSSVFLLILVPSTPNHVEHRLNIRTTWGSIRNGIKLLFMLGIDNDKQVQEDVEKESKLYGDIVQGNVIDSYRNITYKTVMSMKYVVYHCADAAYVLKVDDDSFVNTPLLLNFLKTDLSPFDTRNLFLCNDMTYSPVLRDNSSKWYVPEDVYPDEYYPSYCSGWYVLLTPNICFLLYEQAQKLKYLFIEDAFVYGIAASKVPSLKHTDISKYTLAWKDPVVLFEGKYDRMRILFGSPNMDIKLIKSFWEYFQNKSVSDSIKEDMSQI